MRLDRNPSIPSRAARWFVFLSAFAFVTYGQSPFQSPPGKSSSGYAAETVIVKPRRGSNAAAVAALHASAGARVRRAFPAIGDLQVVDLPPGLSVEGAFDHYRQSGLVEVERALGWRESGRVGHGQSEHRGVDRRRNQSWLTVSPGSGTGSGSVTLAATANTTKKPRNGQVTIGGKGVTVSQAK